MPQPWKNDAWPFVVLCALFAFPSAFASSEQFSKADRDFAQEMLKNVAADVQKHYYDPKLHGVDCMNSPTVNQTLDQAVTQLAGKLELAFAPTAAGK